MLIRYEFAEYILCEHTPYENSKRVRCYMLRARIGDDNMSDKICVIGDDFLDCISSN